MSILRSLIGSVLALTLMVCSSVLAQCGGWSTGFGEPTAGVPQGQVLALQRFDDGSGSKLYVGGSFTLCGGIIVNNIACWDGSTWRALANGVTGSVCAMTVFDDGTGPALYVGGDFLAAGEQPASRIAKWNGSYWAALGAGVNLGVACLQPFDDGTGNALYVGGSFTASGATLLKGVARWNGSTWTPCDAGFSQNVPVRSLCVAAASGVQRLYSLRESQGVSPPPPSELIGMWNGAQWVFLPEPPNVFPFNAAAGLAGFTDENGSTLYLAADSNTDGSLLAWNGSAWSGVPAAIGYLPGGGPRVILDSAGPVLCHLVGDVILFKRPNSAWSTSPSAGGSIAAIESYDDGNGSMVYAGGSFQPNPDYVMGTMAKLGSTAWLPVNTFDGLDGTARCLKSGLFRGSSALFAGGNMTAAGSSRGRLIAQWDGADWLALGQGLGDPGVVLAVELFDEGSGNVLFAGGEFQQAGGVPASNVAKWDGTQWHAVGGGVDNYVLALAAFNDGSGPALFAGGRFLNAGGVPVNHIARWNGSSWNSLAGGMNETVWCLAPWQSGGTRYLVAGGDFSGAGGVGTNRIAAWDGTAWHTLGLGVSSSVFALATYDDGTGPALFAGGGFTSAGGIPASRIARWDGMNWTGLGSGVNGGVYSLFPYDDGSGTGPGLWRFRLSCG